MCHGGSYDVQLRERKTGELEKQMAMKYHKVRSVSIELEIELYLR